MSRRLVRFAAASGAAVLLIGGPCAGQPATGTGGAERSYLSANGLLNRGMYELAAGEYEKFLAASEDHKKAPVARYGLAVCRVRLKDFDGAAEELRGLRGVEGFEFAPEVGLLLAQCEMARGRWVEAAETAQGTVERHAGSAAADDVAGVLAEARYRAGDFAGARRAGELMAREWSESPGRGRAELIWGLAAVAMGEDAAAAERLEGLAAVWPESEAAGQALLVAGQARHRMGEFAAARALYERVIAQPKSEQTAEALTGLGGLLRDAGDLAGAAKALDRVGREFGDAPCAGRALMERGRVWLDSGDIARAAACFEAGVEGLGIGGDEAAFWMARCELRAGDAAGAAERLRGAIGEYPGSAMGAEMRFDRVAALVRAGEDAAAAAELAEFEQRFAGHALRGAALEMHAGAEHRLGHYPLSLALCRRALDENGAGGRAAEVEFLAGENLLLDGDEEGSAAAYASVLEREPAEGLRARAEFRLGTVLYQLGRVAEAEPLLERVVDGRRTPPEFRAALLCLGDARFQAGRWEEAEKILADYLAGASAEGTADDALLKLGMCEARLGLPGDAVRRFEVLLEQYPQSTLGAHAQFERGRSLLAMGQPDAARAAFEDVLRRAPEGHFAGAAESQLGSIALAAGDSQTSAEHFARAGAAAEDAGVAAEAQFQQGQALLAAGRYGEAAEVFARVAEAEQGRGRAAAAQCAVALRRAGRAQEALDAFDRYLLAPGEALDKAMIAGVEYERARALSELDRSDEAAEVYRGLIDAGPGGMAVYALVELAALESEAGDEAEAGRLLARAMEAAGGAASEVRSQAAYRLSASQFKQGLYAESARTLDGLLESEGAGGLAAPAIRLRAQARMAQGRPVQAVADYRRLVGEFPEVDGAAGDLMGLGESLAAAQDWSASERVMAEYLERFSAEDLWFRARFGLGWAVENQGRHEEAIREYAGVIAGHEGPTAARAQFQTGECLFAMKRYEEAARELLKVDILYAYPEWSAAALFEAGRCLALMNRPEEAAAQFAAVTEKHETTEWAALAARELTRLGVAPAPGTLRTR